MKLLAGNPAGNLAGSRAVADTGSALRVISAFESFWDALWLGIQPLLRFVL